MLDAGCGPGMLAIGASLLGASNVAAMDIDEDALEILKDNMDDIEIANIDPILSNFLDSKLFR